MQFMTALFVGPPETVLPLVAIGGGILLFVIVLVWLGIVSIRAARQPRALRSGRLRLVESVDVGDRRRLLIVRRDDVEHLILTGGPQDLLVESGLPAPQPEARPARAMRRPVAPAASEPAPPASESPVSHEMVERLNDLARPAPLRPRNAPQHATGYAGSRDPGALGPYNRSYRQVLRERG